MYAYLCGEMKFISVLLLCVCLFAATFSKWILIASFEINQNYIKTTLCENKNKPEMHCNGKCFLAKQLHDDEQPSKQDNASKERFEIQLFFVEAPNNFSFATNQECRQTPAYQHLHNYSFHAELLEPPRFI